MLHHHRPQRLQFQLCLNGRQNERNTDMCGVGGQGKSIIIAGTLSYHTVTNITWDATFSIYYI